MTTDDFLLDQVERNQRQQTRRRRDKQSRRRQLYTIGVVVALMMLALGGPSLISHSSIGTSMAAQTLADYGLEGTVESVRIGWVTPLRVTGLKVQGKAGSEIAIDQVDMDMTVSEMLRSSTELGQVAVRGVNIACLIGDGRCSLEDDLQLLLEPSESSTTTTTTLALQDITVSATDVVSGGTWQISQCNADVALALDRTEATFAGVLTEPGNSGGSLQGSIVMEQTTDAESSWRLDLTTESLPLSVVSLLRRRFPDAASIPERVHGDATGSVLISSAAGGAVEASIRNFQVRNLTAADQGSRVWNNGLATLDGDLVLVGNRVIGKQLQASTDFASATIDGAFSRTFSLVGANDNPLRWLEAIDGTATAQIDLAAFNRSLPGILPLRDGVQIVSGSAVARVDSSPQRSGRSSQLTMRSDVVKAQANGRNVVIEPIQLNATVSSDQGQIRADQFEWKSTFGSAIGQGDLRAGNADLDIDFGRLTAMLRPIIQISDTTLAGSARGNIQWNAAANNIWRLSGTGNATNLLITLPGGQSLRRPAMEGTVEAVGRWGGKTLQELSRAKITLNSNGMDLQAELAGVVRQPSLSVPMPIQIRGDGRIETLLDTLGPWLPAELHDGAGSFSIRADAEASTVTTRLTTATIDLTQPRLAYGQRYFSQPKVRVVFDGDYMWPTNELQAKTFTIAGDAFSMAAKGTVMPRLVSAPDAPPVTVPEIDMHIKWRAKLERIQGSVRPRVASRPGTVQQVGYRPGTEVQSDDWLVMGDCEGEFRFASQNGISNVQTLITGSDVAVIQPPKASAAFQTVGPMPNRGSQPTTSARVVWAEPNLKFDGLVQYDGRTGGFNADAVQVSGDWFATTLTGSVIWNQTNGQVDLRGPARLKMNEVAKRLSSLAGVPIEAVGIQETPLEIQVSRKADQSIALNVLGNLGWESASTAGISVGRASVPVRLTETSVLVSPSRIPVEQGIVNLAGEVNYRPGPLWMRVSPGVVADSIELTPEMTNRWLKYLAPLAANAAQISGTVGAEIDDCVIVFDQPSHSRVRGRLTIGGARMTAGPMADQILSGINQLKALAKPQGNASQPGQTLITFPGQTVDFALEQGVVTHERLFLEIDRAQVVTSGQVALDGRLNMVARVPLDPRWLGNDLQGLAGQHITLPIDGTLSRPSLDSSGVAQVLQQVGVQAVQSAAENVFQKQFNRVLDKAFGN